MSNPNHVICYIVTFVIMLLITFPSFAEDPKMQEQKKRPLIKILSIDGGGVRGIIPTIVLEALEKQIPEPLESYFDVIAGTSCGGLLTCMLSVKSYNIKKASYIKNIFPIMAKQIFKKNLFHSLKSGFGLFASKYDDCHFCDELDTYFGNLTLDDCTTNILIPAYEANRNETFFFKSNRDTKVTDDRTYTRWKLSEVCRATSSAPTFFDPFSVQKEGENFLFIDGAISANNPTLAAVLYAMEIYGPDIDILVVSLGTGTIYDPDNKNYKFRYEKSSGLIGWATDITSIMFSSENSIVDHELFFALNFEHQKYYRFQVSLKPGEDSLDDVSDKNITRLINYAKELTKDRANDIKDIADILKVSKLRDQVRARSRYPEY